VKGLELKAGTTQDTDVDDKNVAGEEATPSKMQASLGEYTKEAPTMVTTVPPSTEPRAGNTENIFGSVKAVKVEKSTFFVAAKSPPELKETEMA
jgi:hypothetical protein